jgi:hypothetical protein
MLGAQTMEQELPGIGFKGIRDLYISEQIACVALQHKILKQFILRSK